MKLLTEAGLPTVVPEGGYFLLADISNLAKNFKQMKMNAKIVNL